MRVKVGEDAKLFNVVDVFDRKINLEDYRGKKLMLSFYRYASCPLCNMRVHQLISEYDKFQESNMEMLGFFQSPKKSILEYVGKQDSPFPIIPDPKRKVYKDYGIESSLWGYIKGGAIKLGKMLKALKGFGLGRMEGNKTLIPADFLIGPDLKIEVAYYGKDIGDHIPIEEIHKWLDKK